MGILSMVEDRPTPRAVYNWRVYLLAAVASFTSCMIGYDSAFIGGTIALDSFQEEFKFDEMTESSQNLLKANIVSLYQAGAFFGAFFAYPVGHFFGRKIGLIASALVFTLGAGIMLGLNRERGFGIMYAGRVLAGIGVGAGSNITPIYISELSPPAIRGRLVGVYELGWQVGGLVGFWINVCSDRALPLLVYPCSHTDLIKIDLVRSRQHAGTEPQTVVNPARSSDHSLRSPTYWSRFHSGITSMALPARTARESHSKPHLDSPTSGG